MRNAIRYKDCWAMPGSALHEALKDGNADKAQELYKASNDAMKARGEYIRKDWNTGTVDISLWQVVRGMESIGTITGLPARLLNVNYYTGEWVLQADQECQGKQLLKGDRFLNVPL